MQEALRFGRVLFGRLAPSRLRVLVLVDQSAAGLLEAFGGFKLLQDRVENSVDEFAAVLGAEDLGDLNQLVDRDFWGDFREIEEFADPHLQEDFVDDRDAAVFPVRDLCPDDLLALLPVADDLVDQFPGELIAYGIAPQVPEHSLY